MLKERRKSAREPFNRFARVQGEPGSPSRDCLIINMSDDGVRLHVENFDVPTDFQLIMSDGPQQRRSCRVVWRLGFEYGAQFTDRVTQPRPMAAPAA